MNLGFSITICIFAILICLTALVLNVISGNIILALIMIFCIVVNVFNLIKMYGMTSEYERY